MGVWEDDERSLGASWAPKFCVKLCMSRSPHCGPQVRRGFVLCVCGELGGGVEWSFFLSRGNDSLWLSYSVLSYKLAIVLEMSNSVFSLR